MRRAPLAALFIMLAACSGGDGGTESVTPTPTIGLTASPATLTLTPGQSGSANVTLARGGNYSGAVALTVTGAPAGVTVTPSPASLTGSTTSSSLTVAAAANTTPGTYTLSVAGSGTGVSGATTSIALTVNAAAQTLAVSKNGTGTGTVTSSPAGIDCGSTCAASFAQGTNVTLTAAPAAGSAFAGWAGACSGTTATCTVAMSAAQTVTATFNTSAVPGFSLALAPNAVSVTAGGAAATSTATVTRANGFAGAVTLAATGAPNGLTVTTGSVAAGATTATINVTAAATTAAGTYPITITGTGAGLTTPMTQTLSVTVAAPAPTPTIALAIAPTSVSVQQGGTGTATATITRGGGFTGAVNLAVSGAPNGVTVTPNPASVTGTTSTLNVSATSSAAVGSYTITVTGTGTGVAQQTATFSVQVTQAPGGGGGNGGNVKFAFCAPDLPIWFAYQDGTGAWTRVTGTNDTYSFNIGARGGVAYVTPQGTGYDLTVVYGTASELSTGGNAPCQQFPSGTKHLTGTVAGLGPTQGAFVSLGADFQPVFGTPSFQFDSLPNGPLTLVATRFGLDFTTGSFGAPDKVILRRNVDYPNNSAIPTLDFGGSEAFAPATANVTIANLGADSASTGVGFYAGYFGLGFFSLNIGGATQQYAGLPSSKLQAGDLHYLFVSASASTDDTALRGYLTYFNTVTDRTVTLGPSMSAPTVNSLGGSSYARLRAQVAGQAAYGQMATVDFTQGQRSATVSATAAYYGGTPATWDLAIPDLSAADFQSTWAPQSGLKTDWNVSVFGGNYFQLVSGTPSAGSNYQYASKSGSLASAARGFSRSPVPSAIRGTPVAGALQRIEAGRRAMR